MLISKVLQEWSSWGIDSGTAPELVRALSAGTRHRSFLLSNGRHFWVCKLHQPQNCTAIVNSVEMAVQHGIAQLGLAPNVIYQDPGSAYSISEYIQGTHPSRISSNTPPVLHSLLEGIKQYQAQAIGELYRIDYRQTLLRYWQSCDAAHQTVDAQNELTTALNRAEQYDQCYGQQRCLVHHDLNAQNILLKADTNQPCFIDWEFAALGIASLDYAALIIELGLDIKSIDRLTAFDKTELQLAVDVYRALCRFYHLASQR